MSIDNRIVGANIAKLRNNRGMTQFQLAAALNVSHQAVSKWETGAALPDIQTLLTLTQLFGVTMEALLNTEIVIREEEAAGEEPEEESAETIFPGFLNDLIPEEAKKALKNAAGEARKTFVEVSESLSARAEKTFSKAAEFAEKAKSDIESRIKAAKEAPVQPQAEEAAPESEKNAPKTHVSFENLARMAPFMSREKLSDLVLRYGAEADLESIVQIAPFLPRAAVQKLIERCISKKADNQLIRHLAPYAGADALYQLILNNLDTFDWKTLEGLAPFLKRPMVDALTEYAITGVKPEETVHRCESQDAKESFKDAFQGMMGEIGNMVSEIGNAARSVFTPRQEANQAPGEPEEPEVPEEPEIPEEPEVPEKPEIPDPPTMEEIKNFIPTMDEIEKFIPSIEETEKFIPSPEETEKFVPADIPSEKPEESIDKAARHALETGNWSFIRDHAGEITDESLLGEIAAAAVSAVAQTDCAAIEMKIAHRLNDEGRRLLFKKIADEAAWELAVAVHIAADEENARTIIEKAALAEGADREEAYLAIECYAKIAPKETLEKITETALKSDNWVLINALADAY